MLNYDFEKPMVVDFCSDDIKFPNIYDPRKFKGKGTQFYGFLANSTVIINTVDEEAKSLLLSDLRGPLYKANGQIHFDYFGISCSNPPPVGTVTKKGEDDEEDLWELADKYSWYRARNKSPDGLFTKLNSKVKFHLYKYESNLGLENKEDNYRVGLRLKKIWLILEE